MTLTLYGMNSPNVRKVGILLEELGLDYALRYVAVFASGQFAPEFRALNPFAKVPVLVDPALGVPLFESGAILTYLAETHGRFLPASGAARYEVLGWLTAQMALVGPMLGQLNHFRLLGAGAEPYAEGRYAAQAARIYALADERLTAREWIAGDAYSIADIAFYPWMTYLEQHGFAAADYPALLRWRDAIAARDAVTRSAARFAEAFNAPSAESRNTATVADLNRFFGRTETMPAADYAAALGVRA